VSNAQAQARRRGGVFVGRIRGIDLYLDYSWFAIAAILTYTLSAQVFPETLPARTDSTYFTMGLLAAMLFFLSLLLHELGHSVVSQRCGIPVPRITLLFIGGLAEISREPDDAKSELKIALGGPAVTVVLVGFFAVLAWLFGRANYQPASSVCEVLGLVNAQLLAFNMIPGYPLDGGRVLRALIWAKTGKLRTATFITSRIGIGFSWLLIALGVYLIIGLHQWTGLIFFLIAMFLKTAAHSGYAHALQKEVLGGKAVRDIMSSHPVTVPAGLPLNLVVDEYFLTNHHVAFPVCDDDGRFRGLLRIEMLKTAPKERWPYVTAAQLVAENDAEDLGIEMTTGAGRAMRRLLVQGSSRLAVLDQGQVVGMITRHDILHFIEIHNELED
jgi:Zn-dependent protease